MNENYGPFSLAGLKKATGSYILADLGDSALGSEAAPLFEYHQRLDCTSGCLPLRTLLGNLSYSYVVFLDLPHHPSGSTRMNLSIFRLPRPGPLCELSLTKNPLH